ncbi:carbohydrate kinase family protein [Paenibacillus sp. sptzw28]|uniref:carbohydrate kinase family protein n=1 Tax=Paenibacillus sp. sptzw28 TaxID=715179 RepID=UPI001C6EE5D7|nr:carbohydrate kinase family protein [Paenibacillus sp. sptzw28]QYR23569.1 carbohydrate kinase family protein [Paenibacillus sp. sptzw28]
MKKYDAVVIGDANIDLIVVGCLESPLPGQEVFVRDMRIEVGGGAALFSLALAKLGMRIAFNGILGGDYFGTYIRDEFKRHGIDTRYMKKSAVHKTGISIAINPEKDRSFITYSGSNAELSLQLLDLESAALGRHVHLTNYKGSLNHREFMDMVEKLKSMGITTSCDTGWDDTGEWYKGIYELMERVDVFFMNETEANHYTGCSNADDSLKALAKHSSHIIVKLGSHGAISNYRGKTNRKEGFHVRTVDTTGAGDCFNAGYIYGFLSGKDPEECLLYGNVCGAMSVGAVGGSRGAPGREELLRFIDQHDKGGRTMKWGGG